MRYNSYAIQSAVEVTGYAEPVLLPEMKTFMRVSNTVEDAMINIMIPAARKFLEKFTGTWFKPYTVNVIAKNPLGNYNFFFPVEPTALLTWNNPPQGSVSADLKVGLGLNQRVITEPTEFDLNLTAVVGYGTTSYPLPEDIKLAIMCEVTSMYYNRGDSNKSDAYSQRARVLIAPYMRITI